MATQQATASAVSVFVHSTGTGPFLWDRIPETVLGGTPKIAPANVGYPPNAPLARGTTTSAKEDAALVLAAIPDTASAVHLYAHSYGGYVALELLSLLGARVASLFLYEPVLFGALAREEGALVWRDTAGATSRVEGTDDLELAVALLVPPSVPIAGRAVVACARLVTSSLSPVKS